MLTHQELLDIICTEAVESIYASRKPHHMNWNAAHHPVADHGRPPVAFLDELLAIMRPLPDALFEPMEKIRDLIANQM